MKINREDKWWVLKNGKEELCRAENMEFDDAIDAFVANFPEHAKELDELKCGEFCGTPKPVSARREKRQGIKKRGSGARFRELILQGKTNEECLRIVREEFPESKATLSDAAWQRAILRKEPSKYSPNGSVA